MRFANKSDFGKLPQHAKNEYLEWKPEESERIRLHLERLLNIAPGLLDNARANGRILLFRAAPSKDSAYAYTFLGSIVISDKALRSNDEKSLARALVHELTHAADSGCQIALSKSWSAFAGPLIKKIRIQRLMISPRLESKLDIVVHNSNELPSLYAANSLVESLAEYVAAYLIDGNFVAAPEFVNSFAPQVLEPNDRLKHFTEHYNKAVIQSHAKNTISAHTQLKELVYKYPDCSTAFIQLATVCESLKKQTDALEYARVADQLLSDSKVPLGEPIRLQLTIEYCELLDSTGNHVYTKPVLDWLYRDGILAECPAALKLRSRCAESSGDLSAAAYDLYCAKFSPDANHDLPLSVQDQKIVLPWLDEIVIAQSDAGAFILRASYLHRLAEASMESPTRNEFLQRALLDVQESMKMPYSLPIERLVFCSELQLELGHISEARKLYLAAVREKGGLTSLRVRILNLRILEAERKNELAKSEFEWIKNALETRKDRFLIGPRASTTFLNDLSVVDGIRLASYVTRKLESSAEKIELGNYEQAIEQLNQNKPELTEAFQISELHYLKGISLLALARFEESKSEFDWLQQHCNNPVLLRKLRIGQKLLDSKCNRIAPSLVTFPRQEMAIDARIERRHRREE